MTKNYFHVMMLSIMSSEIKVQPKNHLLGYKYIALGCISISYLYTSVCKFRYL